MNFDQAFYNNILQAAHNVLRQNLMQVGQQFADGFMVDFTPVPHNPQTQQNAINFYTHVANETRRLTGTDQLSPDLLHQIVTGFVTNVFQRWRQTQQQNQSPFGNNRQTIGFTNGSGGGFNNNNGQQGGLNFSLQSRPAAGGHLADDIDVRPAAPTAPVATAPVAPVQMAPVVLAKAYANGPLDDLPETGIEFVSNTATPDWSGVSAKDDRIVVSYRAELKTRDQRFTINNAWAYHQEIMDDPMAVAKDFFTVAPDSVLASPFVYSVNYNHLDVLDVPTADFIAVRDKCIEVMKSDPTGLIHVKLIEKLQTMQFAPYQAMANYLTKHINRALHLAMRLSNDPSKYIKISAFEDLNELLSSSFQNELTNYPTGRTSLETIVANAIWNALVKNVGVMFEDDETIPTHAIQSSPAFPYSMKGVYPNKFSIPTSADADRPEFMAKLREYQLSRKTFLLSRRKVVLTNILGKKVLPELKTVPQKITSPVASVLMMTRCYQPYNDANQMKLPGQPVVPFAEEDYPSDQFQAYQSDPETQGEKLVEKNLRQPIDLPVDVTIFAIQNSVDPLKFMDAVDVFTTIDDNKAQNVIILGDRDIPTLSVKK